MPDINKKILVVDDEPDVVRWLTILLENNAYTVVSAVDGSEGFSKAMNDKPDLIILDISMPKESGVKMYRKLHDFVETSKIPVIMLTGVAAEFEHFISTRKQVKPPDAYFEKPVDTDVLLNKIKEIIS